MHLQMMTRKSTFVDSRVKFLRTTRCMNQRTHDHAVLSNVLFSLVTQGQVRWRTNEQWPRTIIAALINSKHIYDMQASKTVLEFQHAKLKGENVIVH